jgi:hypothetical protein
VAGIQDLIDEQTSADDAEHTKPHPDIFGAALQRLKMDADRPSLPATVRMMPKPLRGFTSALLECFVAAFPQWS